jgi:hypothetical protein
MSWLKWISAYLFDCTHPNTTWPRRNPTGSVYIACLDCGKELPYSLERMRIVATRRASDRSKPGGWETSSAPREMGRVERRTYYNLITGAGIR